MPAPEEALTAGNVLFTGHDGAEINAYQALPAGDGPFPGVLVIHHLPGWDSGTKEITRRFAANGYNALCPNLYARQGLDVDPDDAAAATREAGGVPDEQFVGDAGGAVDALRALPTSNGKVGVIGYCSGGRHSFLTAVSLPVDAAVDCYGAFVVGTPPEGFPLKVTPLVDRTPRAQLPAARPLRQRRPVPQPRAGGRARGGAEGGGQDLRVPPLRRRGPRVLLGRPPGLPARGRGRRLAADLRVVRPLPGGELTMCSYLTVATEVAGSAKGAQGWFRVTSASVYFDHPFHAPFDHTLNIDFADPARGPGARVAVELSAESARRLVESINEALAAAGAAAS